MAEFAVVLPPRLAGLLAAHAAFLAELDPAAGERFRDGLAALFTLLRDDPRRFPFSALPDLPEGVYRAAPFARWYQALFSVAGKTVRLDAVIDGRRKLIAPPVTALAKRPHSTPDKSV